jgi:dimeric dUTPase (all-alpha-NTP-PPase superfamily)
MLEKFKEMLELQDSLNKNTAGEDWKSGITSEGRKINWFRCIYMEASEGIGSLGWKHWKSLDEKDDIDNLKVEAVDIWHFIMSACLSSMVANTTEIAEIMERTCEKAKADFYAQSAERIIIPRQSEIIIKPLEALMLSSLKKQIDLLNFFLLVEAIPNFSMQDVYALYIGKNCLNQFRQDHGYKEAGVYKKIWNGKEDNVYMQEFVNENIESISYDTLYKHLKEQYEALAA